MYIVTLKIASTLSVSEVLGMRIDETTVPALVDILGLLLWLWLLRLSGIRMYSVVLLARSGSTYYVRTIRNIVVVRCRANKVLETN